MLGSLWPGRNRDQLSQTADLVQIHQIYPQWFSGTLHLDQTALCYKSISDKQVFCTQGSNSAASCFSCATQEKQCGIMMHYRRSSLSGEQQMCFPSFFCSIFLLFSFQGPHLHVRMNSHVWWYQTSFGGYSLINSFSLTVLKKKGVGGERELWWRSGV